MFLLNQIKHLPLAFIGLILISIQEGWPWLGENHAVENWGEYGHMSFTTFAYDKQILVAESWHQGWSADEQARHPSKTKILTTSLLTESGDQTVSLGRGRLHMCI